MPTIATTRPHWVRHRGASSVLGFLVWLHGLDSAAVAQVPGPLPCVPARPGDSQPWVHNGRILQSFPPDLPQPRFLGRFATAELQYELHLWRDSSGVFGELLSPVLDADSPISRLYDTQFDEKTGALSFSARFPDTQLFDGRLRSKSITLKVVRGGKSEVVVLKKLRPGPYGAALQGVKSRAQFECEMTLFRRY